MSSEDERYALQREFGLSRENMHIRHMFSIKSTIGDKCKESTLGFATCQCMLLAEVCLRSGTTYPCYDHDAHPQGTPPEGMWYL